MATNTTCSKSPTATPTMVWQELAAGLEHTFPPHALESAIGGSCSSVMRPRIIGIDCPEYLQKQEEVHRVGTLLYCRACSLSLGRTLLTTPSVSIFCEDFGKHVQ